MKLVLASALFAVVAACGDNKPSTIIDAAPGGDGMADATPDAPDGTTVLRTTLSGFQENPPVEAMARGVGVLGVNEAKTEITVEISFSDLDLATVTAAHIHLGKPGINGPVIFTLAAGAITSPFTKTVTVADFSAGGNVNTFDDAVQAVLDGGTYVNVHTTANMGGAVRGHIGRATIKAIASSAQENPPVVAASSAVATLTLNDTQDAIDVSVDTEGLVDGTAAHIHLGGVGHNGPVLFPLGAAPLADPIVVTLAEADLTPATGVADMKAAVDAILSGRTYANVHTTANMGGELRAQLGAVTLRSTLTPGQETANVTSTAKGRAFVTIDAEQTRVTTNVTFEGLTDTTAAHIHVGPLDVNGPPIFTLGAAGVTSPINKALVEADLTAQTGAATFAAAVNAILTGNTYVNVHTAANTGGEIRGQVGRAILSAPTMTGSKQRPVVVSPGGTGNAAILIAGDQRSVSATFTYTLPLAAQATGADIRIGNTMVDTADAPVLFESAAAFASPSTFLFTSADLKTSTGVANMADAIGKLLDQGTFANIRSELNPNGELRDQIVAP